MELFTRDRAFVKKDPIENFKSLIWTERWRGDGDAEIVVPATYEMFNKLRLGTFITIESSNEPMILETVNAPPDGTLKYKAISLLKWMNNRFVRTSDKHEDQYWYIENKVAGEVIWMILFNMVCEDSPYLDGTIDTAIPNPEKLIVPGIVLRGFPTDGPIIGEIETKAKKPPKPEPKPKIAIPFGPVYDEMAKIGKTYDIGMRITLDSVTEDGYELGFLAYRGLDRTSGQTENLQVRFSKQMDSLTNIEEVQSMEKFKNLVYAFAPNLKVESGPPLTDAPGIASVVGTYTGFDLRALQVFATDISTDQVGSDEDKVLEMLNAKAKEELIKNKFVKTVDGEIVPESQVKYGVHYNLGDLIEVQGNTGAVQIARVTEYIQSQDETGEKAYPTLDIKDDE